MKKLKYLIYFSICFLTTSCSINGNFQGLFSYYKKTVKDNPNLIDKSPASICETRLAMAHNVIIANGIKLKQCVNRSANVLVYVWSPNCKSGYCYSLNAIQTKCDEKNIELYIVAEYYDGKKMQLDYHLRRSIIGIDTKYYKTNLTSKYLSKFINDLTSKSDIHNRFLYFTNGILSKSFDSIDSI